MVSLIGLSKGIAGQTELEDRVGPNQFSGPTETSRNMGVLIQIGATGFLQQQPSLKNCTSPQSAVQRFEQRSSGPVPCGNLGLGNPPLA